jgi:hypothetical protein
MKNTFLFLILFFVVSFGFSQPVTVVVKNPAWEAEDHAISMEQRAKWAEEMAKLSEQVHTGRENLQLLKDATKKLREVNRRIANIRMLEDAIFMTMNAYDMAEKHIARIKANDLLDPETYSAVLMRMRHCLSITNYTIDRLKIVITDNFAEMNDSERMKNLDTFLTKLQTDLAIINAFFWEVERLEYNLMHVRTTQYLYDYLTPKNE